MPLSSNRISKAKQKYGIRGGAYLTSTLLLMALKSIFCLQTKVPHFAAPALQFPVRCLMTPVHTVQPPYTEYRTPNIHYLNT